MTAAGTEAYRGCPWLSGTRPGVIRPRVQEPDKGDGCMGGGSVWTLDWLVLVLVLVLESVSLGGGLYLEGRWVSKRGR